MFDFRSRSREEDSILSEPVDQDVALISKVGSGVGIWLPGLSSEITDSQRTSARSSTPTSEQKSRARNLLVDPDLRRDERNTIRSLPVSFQTTNRP